MTSYEAARKRGVQTCAVSKWIKRKKIPATKVPNAKGRMVWDIPDDTECPTVKSNSPSETAERRTLAKKGVRGYVAKYAGIFSIRHMADFLGIASDKVRSIYDDILTKGGF